MVALALHATSVHTSLRRVVNHARTVPHTQKQPNFHWEVSQSWIVCAILIPKVPTVALVFLPFATLVITDHQVNLVSCVPRTHSRPPEVRKSATAIAMPDIQASYECTFAVVQHIEGSFMSHDLTYHSLTQNLQAQTVALALPVWSAHTNRTQEVRRVQIAPMDQRRQTCLRAASVFWNACVDLTSTGLMVVRVNPRNSSSVTLVTLAQMEVSLCSHLDSVIVENERVTYCSISLILCASEQVPASHVLRAHTRRSRATRNAYHAQSIQLPTMAPPNASVRTAGGSNVSVSTFLLSNIYRE